MPAKFNILKDPFVLLSPTPMRFSVLVCLCTLASIVRDLTTPSALAEQEALILRNELRLTREALEESRGFQEHCAWRIWALNWTLRVLSLVDLGFLIYLVYTHFTRRRRVVVVPPETHLEITGDTKGVSDSDSPINSPRRIESKGSRSSGSSPKSKGRPTRPSDRKTKQ